MKAKGFLLQFLFCTAFIIMPAMMPIQYPEHVDEYGYFFIDYACTTSFPKQFTKVKDIKERKQLLMDMLLPLVLKANEEVMAQRMELLKIKKTSFYLTIQEVRFIEELATYYRVEPGDHRAMLDELLVRVNVLPASLVLAQAAIESGWGTSRFALMGNNLFGLRGPRGNGMEPREVKSNGDFSLSTFVNLQSCISYYIWNINTHTEYKDLRQIRLHKTFPYDSTELAQGLTTYSEMGSTYVDKVVDLIDNNNLKAYDFYRLKTVETAWKPNRVSVLLAKR